MAEPAVLVFGATAVLGRHVLDGLQALGVEPATVTAAGRNPGRLKSWVRPASLRQK